MKQIIYSLVLILLLSLSSSAFAQDDQPLVTEISYDMTVQETITDHAFFDWWQIDVEIGDVMVISMEAADGLQPLLGLLDENSELVTRSDLESVAEVDGVAIIQHTVVTAGKYTIIASRDGRDQGTTTGAYLLTVINRNAVTQSRPNPFLETEFRCSEWLLTNALTFQFEEDINPTDTNTEGQKIESYRISVYGLDGFEPVIRIIADILQDRPLDCTDSPKGTEGSEFNLPFFDSPYVITSNEAENSAMVTLTNSGTDPLGKVTVSIGAKDGTSGRFIVVLEGLELQDRSDEDDFLIRRGAFAGDTALDVYMIGYPDNRLDSLLQTEDETADNYLVCDDIGRDSCADFTALTQSTIAISDNSYNYVPDRFDSELRLDAPENEPRLVTFRSREYNTAGKYLVMFVGELPASD